MINKEHIFNKIAFATRYKALCEQYNDFENRMRGTHKELYDKVLISFKYPYKYAAKDKVYSIREEMNNFQIILQLTFHDGLIEPNITIKEGREFCSPFGRFDFIPERMSVAFDRNKYNLPKYSNEEQLKAIMGNIFSIYEDIKKALIGLGS